MQKSSRLKRSKYEKMFTTVEKKTGCITCKNPLDKKDKIMNKFYTLRKNKAHTNMKGIYENCRATQDYIGFNVTLSIQNGKNLRNLWQRSTNN